MASLQRPSKDESRPSVSSSPAAPTARQHDSTSIGSRTPGSVASPLSGQRFEDLQRQGVIHHADALAQQAAAAAGGAVRRSIAVGPVMTAAHFASSNVDARGMGPEVMAAADLKSLSARQHGRGLEQGAQAAQQVSPNQLTGSFRMQAAAMPYGAFAGYGELSHVLFRFCCGFAFEQSASRGARYGARWAFQSRNHRPSGGKCFT